MTTFEEALKPLFDQWLEEALPEIGCRFRQEIESELEAKTNKHYSIKQKWRNDKVFL